MSKRLTHEQFLGRLSPFLSNYDILSKYETAEVKVKVKCRKCGYEWEAKPHQLMAGRGCRKCKYKKVADNMRKPFSEFVANLPNKYAGYEFSGYSGASSPITAKCPTCGRKHTYANAKAFTSGTAGCRSCHNSRYKGDKELATLCEANGFTLMSRLSPVRSGKYLVSQAKVVCNRCGRVSRRNISNISRSGCKFCNNNLSKDEDAIYEWVKSICPDAQRQAHKIISNELDIYIPSAKVAIEYNGTYWHCDKYKDKTYHSEKSLECRDLGIRLIHIWEYEWKVPKKRRVLENIILGALNMLPERVYARQCDIKRYDNGGKEWQKLNQFFDNNNIQGNRGGSLVYTLEKDGEILMAYKFGRPSGGKAKNKYEYEMVRGASKLGTQVVGGATRLWKHFMDDVRPKSVVYYVDFNYFDGRSLEKIGGKYIGHTDSYRNWWVKNNVVKNRDPKNHLIISELESQGKIRKIWNAGVLTYVFGAAA